MSAGPSIVLVLVLVIELWPLPVKAVTPIEPTKAATSSIAATAESDELRTSTGTILGADRPRKARKLGTGQLSESSIRKGAGY